MLRKASIKKGFGFGLTSGIITTLGLMIGLYSTTKSSMIIIEGIIIIAIADAFSDALGMHISEESNSENSKECIWEATFSTFFTKFIFALTFIIPFLLFSLGSAIIISLFWGFALLSIFSYYLALRRKQSKIKTIGEHIFIGILVIVITYYVGELVSGFFV